MTGLVGASAYSTRPKRGPIEAAVAGNQWVPVNGIPRVLSVAPLKRSDGGCRSPAGCGRIPRVLSVAPLKLS